MNNMDRMESIRYLREQAQGELSSANEYANSEHMTTWKRQRAWEQARLGNMLNSVADELERKMTP